MKAATTNGEGREASAADVGCDWEGDCCWADGVNVAEKNATPPFARLPDAAFVDGYALGTTDAVQALGVDDNASKDAAARSKMNRTAPGLFIFPPSSTWLRC